MEKGDLVTVEIDQLVMIEFKIRPMEVLCVAQGNVVRSRELGFAVEFDELSQELESFINDLEVLPSDAHPEFIRNVMEPQIRVA